MDPRRLTPFLLQDFTEWWDSADKDERASFIEYVEEEILDLEMDDFFGTEGLNKRLG